MKSNPEMSVGFDIDDTLLMADNSEPHDVSFADPHDPGKIITGRIHKRHIKLLKDYKARGFYIVIWSGNGKKYADAVVKALKIKKYVDHTMAKFSKFVDDLPAEKILVNRVYLNEKGSLET